MDIPHDARVAVLDGRKFLLLRNSGDEVYPVLDVEEEHEMSGTTSFDADAETVVDDGQPGGPGGPGTHAGRAQVDDRKKGEVDFAAEMAERLNTLVKGRRFDRLVVVAAPKTLGELRKRYDKQLEAALVGEVAKEMTNRPPQDIAEALKAQ